MKKRLLTLILLSILSTNITACGNNSPESNKQLQSTDETESKPKNNETETQIIPESENASENNSSKVSEKTLKDIENYLLDQGVLSGERTQMAASMVGGIDGFKYADSGVEIYEYDINSEEYISLSNGEEIDLEGMDGFKIGAKSINGKFVLMGEPSQEIIDTFNSYQ